MGDGGCGAGPATCVSDPTRCRGGRRSGLRGAASGPFLPHRHRASSPRSGRAGRTRAPPAATGGGTSRPLPPPPVPWASGLLPSCQARTGVRPRSEAPHRFWLQQRDSAVGLGMARVHGAEPRLRGGAGGPGHRGACRRGHADPEGGLEVTGERGGRTLGGCPPLPTAGSPGQVNKRPPTTASPPVTRMGHQPLPGTQSDSSRMCPH